MPPCRSRLSLKQLVWRRRQGCQLNAVKTDDTYTVLSGSLREIWPCGDPHPQRFKQLHSVLDELEIVLQDLGNSYESHANQLEGWRESEKCDPKLHIHLVFLGREGGRELAGASQHPSPFREMIPYFCSPESSAWMELSITLSGSGIMKSHARRGDGRPTRRVGGYITLKWAKRSTFS